MRPRPTTRRPPDAARAMLSFREATAVRALDSHTYAVELAEDWVIGTVPHGGYVTSCLQRAVALHFATTLRAQRQPHPLTLHLEFPRRTAVGPATIRVRDVKLGRQVSAVHVALEQDGREEVVGYLNHADLGAAEGVSLATGWTLQPAPRPAPDFARLRRDDDPHWGLRDEWPHVEFRKATRHLQAWFPRAGHPGPACLDLWYRFRDDGTRFTTDTLGLVCDMFPQMLERLILEGADPYRGDEPRRLPRLWYPTLVLNLEVKKALPDEGVEFLFMRVQAKRIERGRYDLEVLICDAAGDLVAISHHVVFVLGAERNEAARRKGGSGNAAKM